MRLLKSRLGKLVTRPWLDRLLLYLLRRLFFPLSRLWAAARAADGDVDRYVAAVPLSNPGNWRRTWIARAIDRFEHRRLRAFSTEQLWELYFFGEQEVELGRLPIVEEMRLDNRTAYNFCRKSFLPLLPLVKTSVQMNPPTLEEVEREFGKDGADLERAFALPEQFPRIERSRGLPMHHGSDYWLRFESPSKIMSDTVYARVHEPEDVEDPPTLIFGHGICVEFDHYRQLLDEITALTAQGIRVIRPESPWHGRRVLPGHYGGEQFLSTLPHSMIDFLVAQYSEWATLIDWCRSTSSGPVAIGGSSLGAPNGQNHCCESRRMARATSAESDDVHQPRCQNGGSRARRKSFRHLESRIGTAFERMDSPRRAILAGSAGSGR